MLFVVTVCRSCIFLFAIAGVISAQQVSPSENPESMATSLPVCSVDNSVCNILIKNESSKVDEIEQVCACAHGRLCPSAISKADTIRFLDSEWFVTCVSLDTIPACAADQVSLFSEMESLDEPVNFLVKCTCPNGYDTNGALWRLDGTKVLVEIYCNDVYEVSHDDYGDNSIIDFENEEQKDMKRNRGNNAFYKRGRTDGLYSFYKRGRTDGLYSFYKRGGSDVSGFYKRGLNSLRAFYKRAPFYKRAAESHPKVAPSKRSVHYYKTFYKRAPFGHLNAFYKRDFIQDSSLGLDKKNARLDSFYKRDYDNNDSSFYKRDRFGINSFYKRAVDNPSDLQTRDNDEENFPVSDERPETKDETSLVNEKSLGSRVRLHYNPYTVLSRLPWYRSVGTSADYIRRDSGNYRHSFS